MTHSLNRAKTAKDDEFYTLLPDIERELQHYPQFAGKTVYANCDNDQSAFVEYFRRRTDLKEFVHTSTDFRRTENLVTMKRADIICTNPPFSLFREYFYMVRKLKRKFLVIGNLNAAKYNEVLPYFVKNAIWLGYGPPGHTFRRPDGSMQKLGFSTWFTNLHHAGRDREIVMTKTYHPDIYPKYDNLDAINVERLADIPKDYYGPMGVPFTFLQKYNPRQFRIIGLDMMMRRSEGRKWARLNGKKKFARLVIQRVSP